MVAADASETANGNLPILIVQTAFLGDLLLTIPFFKRLKELRPRAPLHLVTREGIGRVIKDLELVDEVYEVKKGDPGSYKKVQEKLRGLHFEWIFCPHESLTTANFIRPLQAETKIGFSKWWNFPFFQKRLPKNFDLPEALRLMELLRDLDPLTKQRLQDLGGQDLKRANQYGGLPAVPSWAAADLSDFLKSKTSAFPANQKTACLFPGSVWATKQWREEGFMEVAEQLVKEGYQVYWMGSKNEMPMTKRMEARMKGTRSLSGQLSLFQCLVLLAHSGLVLSNDSGGQHMAAVAGTKTVTVFGPTVLNFGFRPWTNAARIAELNDVPCRPCGIHGHRKCPIGTHDCMKRLPSALVLQRIHQLTNRESENS